MQDRLTYANGNTITTEGFRCTVGEAIYDDEVVADENGDAALSGYGIAGFNMNSQYLVTLEVNGVSKLYRELWTSGDIDDNNSVPMGEYTFSMDDETIVGLTEGDHVRIKIEPITVYTTDAFRAAVKKSCNCGASGSGLPDYSEASNGDVLGISSGSPAWVTPSGGGSGGGVLVVTETESGDVSTLDKTWQEIYDADYPVIVCVSPLGSSKTYKIVTKVMINELSGKYVVTDNEKITYSADSASDYPTYEPEIH